VQPTRWTNAISLLDARAEVMQALLELTRMPAGMELFSEVNEEPGHALARRRKGVVKYETV
jgi:hypothetical protein